MKSFDWRNDFCTGIEEMDKHHKKFFEYLSQLEEAAGGNKGRDVIEKGLRLADEYIQYHFAQEEKLLEVTGFDEYDHQVREHAFFVSQINELREGYARGDAFLPISTLMFLRDWFSHHILEEDKKYGEYLSGAAK